MHEILTGYSLQFSRKMEKHGTDLIRIALAIVFIWFGTLKVLGMSPAQELVEKTVFWFPPKVFVPLLGACEVSIGIGLLIKRLTPYAILFLLLHMACTFLPFIVLPDTCFDAFPYCPSMEGQYIIKNLVFISGALAVGGKYHLSTRQRPTTNTEGIETTPALSADKQTI